MSLIFSDISYLCSRGPEPHTAESMLSLHQVENSILIHVKHLEQLLQVVELVLLDAKLILDTNYQNNMARPLLPGQHGISGQPSLSFLSSSSSHVAPHWLVYLGGG